MGNAWMTTCMLHVRLEYSLFFVEWLWDSWWQLNPFFMSKQLRYVLFHCVFLYLLGGSCMQMWDLMQAGKWHPSDIQELPWCPAMKAVDPKTGRAGQPQSHCRQCLLFVNITFIRTSCNIIASHVLLMWAYHSISFIIIHHHSSSFIIIL